VRTIVVGYDGSEHADRALDRSIEMATNDTDLVVVSTARIDTGGGHVRGGMAGVDPIEVEAADEALDKARARLAGAAVSTHFIEAHGDPADALVQVAKERGADLIAVGTRGLNIAQRALLGSVSTRVVHSAECDVLVVR
jgi:nucleotide-binding universal stress UspA family protein